MLYADELAFLAASGDIDLRLVYSRRVPPGWPDPPGHLHASTLAAVGVPPAQHPDVYVCGPTGFVETVADLLVLAGHAPERIRTERFG
jgi:ferredoxin-NADP reductase